MSVISVRAVISGRVQGVGYRAWAVARAREKGLYGWVRNLANGSVEALFYGEEAVVEQMLEECLEGPLMARVGNIERFEGNEIPGEYFVSRPTI